MALYDDFRDIVSMIATGIWGDGAGKGLGTNIDELTRSAAYNKMGSYTKKLISAGQSNNIITKEKGDALRKMLSEGSDDIYGNGNLNEIITGLGKLDDENAKNVAKNFSENFAKYRPSETPTTAQYAEFLGKSSAQGIGIGNMASGYFADAKYGKMRREMIATGTVGVAVGARLLSGGSLTQTNTGQRDIAGIPFI